MKRHTTQCISAGWTMCLTLALAANAPAASSLSNSLTGFTGDSSQAGTIAAMATAGFETSSTGVYDDNGTTVPTEEFPDPTVDDTDPRVVYDANGASFGSMLGGNGGRNYMRTIDNYYLDNFVAEITIVAKLPINDTWFGVGKGDIHLYGTPDFYGSPTVFMAPQLGQVATNAADGISGDWITPAPCTQGWCNTDVPQLDNPSIGDYNEDGVANAADYTVWRDLLGTNGPLPNDPTPPTVSSTDYDYWKAHFGEESLERTHRLRMNFNADTKTWVGSIDVDYTGGAFVADGTTLTYDLTYLYDDGDFVLNGWPTQPSRIYFGGDDGVIFKDFSVVVSPAAGGAAGVPEPATIVLLLLAFGGGLALQRQR